jgi:hypothetical protein
MEMVWIMMALMSILAFTLAIQMQSDRMELVPTINEKAGHAIKNAI